MVRLTDRPDMTLDHDDVYRGCKTTNQQQQSSCLKHGISSLSTPMASDFMAF